MKKNRHTLLHVDDDALIRAMVADQLESQGYQVIGLADPKDALRTLLNEDCRVVLLDVQMPGINGLELLQQIKAFDGGVQVIMLTGLVSTTTLLESLRRGAEACLFKPVANYDRLFDVVANTFQKLDRWWEAVEEMRCRQGAPQPAVN